MFQLVQLHDENAQGILTTKKQKQKQNKKNPKKQHWDVPQRWIVKSGS